MTLKIVSSPSDLTEEWFTSLLRSTGDLDEATVVSAADAAPFGSDEAMMSALFRVVLTYDGPSSGPKSLIVKLASQSEGARFIAAVFQLYQREVRFYNELLPKVSIETPRCLYAEMYPDDQGFVLVLEELTNCRQVDQIAGMNFEDATTALEALADLHAPFWGTDLSNLVETMLAFDCDLVRDGLPMKMADDWAQARSSLVDELPAELVDVFDNIKEIGPRAIDDIMAGATTIVHADCRADNLLYNADGSVAILDFQLMAVGHGAFDAAYLISQSLDDETQDRALELIDLYYARLASNGIEVDKDEAAAAYRGAVVFSLGLPLSVLTTEGLPERGTELARVMLARACKEVLRTGGHLAYKGTGNDSDAS